MKHLILAASMSLAAALIAAPAMADNSAAPKNKTATITDPQMGAYGYNSDSAIAQRNAKLRRAAQERSDNARAAWQGSVHYY